MRRPAVVLRPPRNLGVHPARAGLAPQSIFSAVSALEPILYPVKAGPAPQSYFGAVSSGLS